MLEPELVDRLRAAGCVYAEDEAQLLIDAAGDLESLVARRVSGVPLEQVLGWAELAGTRVLLDPGVFVPRRRSELLVREAVARVRPGDVVVDACCGSGAVGAAIAGRADVEVHGCDLDPAAVRCARRNLDRVHSGDLLDALPDDLHVDVVVANAPYVPTTEIAMLPAEARDHEPALSLDGGADGLDVQRRLLAQAVARGIPLVLVETSERQAETTVEIARAAGLVPYCVRDEDLDATVVVAEQVAGRA